MAGPTRSILILPWLILVQVGWQELRDNSSLLLGNKAAKYSSHSPEEKMKEQWLKEVGEFDVTMLYYLELFGQES